MVKLLRLQGCFQKSNYLRTLVNHRIGSGAGNRLSYDYGRDRYNCSDKSRQIAQNVKFYFWQAVSALEKSAMCPRKRILVWMVLATIAATVNAAGKTGGEYIKVLQSSL